MSVQKRRRQAINRRQWIKDLDVRWATLLDRIPRSAQAVSVCGCGRRSWLLDSASEDEWREFSDAEDTHASYCEAAS